MSADACTRTAPCLPPWMIPAETVDPLPYIVAAVVLTVLAALAIRLTNR